MPLDVNEHQLTVIKEICKTQAVNIAGGNQNCPVPTGARLYVPTNGTIAGVLVMNDVAVTTTRVIEDAPRYTDERWSRVNQSGTTAANLEWAW